MRRALSFIAHACAPALLALSLAARAHAQPAPYRHWQTLTTAHFDGYPIVLCRLEQLDPPSMTELIGEAWACRAPKRLVAEHAPPS